MAIELFFCFFFGVQGLIVGSFLNVFIERSPQGKSLSGRSTCDGCSRKLSAYELIPVVSYLWQRGKSVCCNKPLSIQYPIIEGVTGLLFFALTYFYFTYVTGDIAIVHIISLIGLLVALTATIAIIVTDFRTHIIPDTQQVLLLFGSVVYLITFYGYGFQDLLVGLIFLVLVYVFAELIARLNKVAIILFAFTTLFTVIMSFVYILRGFLPTEVSYVGVDIAFQITTFASTYPFLMRLLEGVLTCYPILLMYLVTKGKGMGFGDVKLQFLLGVLLGLGMGFVGLYVGFVLGALYGAVLMILRRANRKTHIAFGPFLLFGAWIAFFFGDNILQILRWYF